MRTQRINTTDLWKPKRRPSQPSNDPSNDDDSPTSSQLRFERDQALINGIRDTLSEFKQVIDSDHEDFERIITNLHDTMQMQHSIKTADSLDTDDVSVSCHAGLRYHISKKFSKLISFFKKIICI